MDGLVRFSFYLFAGSSLAIVASALCYIAFVVMRSRIRKTRLATPQGPVVTTDAATQDAIGMARWGTMLAAFGAVFIGFSILTRWRAGGDFPLSNMYEYSMMFTFWVCVFHLVFERYYRVRSLGALTMTVAALMTGYIWMLPTDLREINSRIPALQANTIMAFHVGTATMAYATFALAFGAAILFLVKDRMDYSWLPSTEMLDDIGFRAITIGFPLLTASIILGSVWANDAWGVYWQWDPKETAALFTWLVYGVYLHTRTLRGWRGTRSAYVLLFGFGATLFTYYGNYFFGGLHAYGGV